MLTESMDFFESKPANHLLKERSSNEAFCRATAEKEYAVYFPDGGEISLSISGQQSMYSVRWLNILSSRWSAEKQISVSGIAKLAAPGEGHWLALLK